MNRSARVGEVVIETLTAGGRGLGRLGGRVWLVEGAVPGDRVEARAVRVRRNLVEARASRIVEPSPARRRPPCPLQGRCGGCPWMVLEESAQRLWKGRLVEDALRRIGRFSSLEVPEILASPRSVGYRNKVELTFGRDSNGRPALGFHGLEGSGAVVDVDRCLLQDDPANRVLAAARGYFLEGPGRSEPALRDRREPLRLVIRCSSHTGRLLVAFRGVPGRFPSARAFARRLVAERPEVGGVVRLLVRPGRRGASRTVTLIGRPWLEESLGGTVFRLPAPAFFQVNPRAAEQLLRLVEGFAGLRDGSRIIDLYGGVGVHAIALARLGGQATVCEADPSAVACGRRAAREAAPGRVRFVRADVGAFLCSGRVPSPVDVVVANPPRTGLAPGIAKAIASLGAARIVMVSCDPPTLARDLRRLTESGYRPIRIAGVDLFPQTDHVETVTRLDRVKHPASG